MDYQMVAGGVFPWTHLAAFVRYLNDQGYWLMDEASEYRLSRVQMRELLRAYVARANEEARRGAGGVGDG